ncbi:MAG TPA: putative Ig domain-containing protein, partial [Deltaproteobacteria bacterium]|nr:putative Ig domain-containing protein [Deltaproteobacteria bacterium]
MKRPLSSRSLSGNAARLCALLIPALCALCLCACSRETQGSGTGSIAFTLELPRAEARYKVPDGWCEENGVVNVVAEVSDASENLVATGGPWPCTAGEGSITNVEEGTGYTITVSLRNSENVVVYHGSRSGIAVVAGMTTEVLDITLTPTNNPPAFDTDVPNQQVNETGTLTFTVSSATDPDGDILTYSAVSLPTGATFTPATRLFSWTPGYDQAGTHTATFQVTDDGTPPMSDTLSVTITVG